MLGLAACFRSARPFALGTLLVWVVQAVTRSRHAAIEALSPDRIRTRTFVGSLHGWTDDTEPNSSHAVELKDCEPYLCSYRAMRLHRPSPNVAVNMLPLDWVTECCSRRRR